MNYSREEVVNAGMILGAVIASRLFDGQIPESLALISSGSKEKAEFPALLTATQTQRYISIGRTKFYQLIKQPGFPRPVDVGGHPRWDRRALDKWIDKQNKRT